MELAFKQGLQKAVVNSLVEKLSEIKRSLDETNDAKNQETKSSAGDKYETSREMIQFESDKLESQFNKTKLQLHEINAINTEKKIESVTQGALVKTNLNTLFFSIPLGNFKFEEQELFLLSMASPMGQILRNKKLGDKVSFNGNTIEILGII